MSDRYAISLRSMIHDEQSSSWKVTFSVSAEFIGNQRFEVKVDDSDPAQYGENIMRDAGDIAARAQRMLALDFNALANRALRTIDPKFKAAIIVQAQLALENSDGPQVQIERDADD